MRSDGPLWQQFARFPELGAVKTRLQTELSASEACDVHCELVETTARNLLASECGPVELWLDKLQSHPLIDRCLELGTRGPFLQRGTDLGQRMCASLQDGLTRHSGVLLVGSDCPGLTPTYLREAWRSLQQHDVVLGAAEDGGYVLIGARRITEAVFDGIGWGGATVLADTCERLEASGWHYAVLPALLDIDTPEDLHRWRDGAG